MATEKIIVSSSGGQKTINNVNPNATNAQLATFGEMLTGLSDDTYQKTDRITKVNCDTEPGGGTKPEPTLTLSKNTCTKAQLGYATADAIITTNSDGYLYARMAYPMSGQEGAYGSISCPATGDKTFSPKSTGYVNPTYPQTLYIGITETDNFKGKEVAYTITES